MGEEKEEVSPSPIPKFQVNLEGLPWTLTSQMESNNCLKLVKMPQPPGRRPFERMAKF